MNASYVSATQYTVAGDQTALFPAGRRVRGDCGVDGYKYGTVQSSSYSDPNTTVTLEESVLTSNLATVHYGVVKPGATGSLPDHASEHHSGGRDPIDHGSLPGLGDDDHTQYIKHALATAVSDFLVASGAGVFIKKTLAEVQALIEGSTNLADAISKKHSQNTDTDLVLTAAPGSDHAASGNKVSLQAGEALAFGELCYVKSDGKMWRTDANDGAMMPGLAMALASISADATGLFLFLGVVRDDSWAWTVGGKIYASETPGALTQTAPTTVGAFVQLVGIATHADRMLFEPELSTIQVK